MSDRLKRLIFQIDTSISDDTIEQWLYSSENDKKLLALLAIRKKVENDFIPAPSYFETAEQFLTENDADCKLAVFYYHWALHRGQTRGVLANDYWAW